MSFLKNAPKTLYYSYVLFLLYYSSILSGLKALSALTSNKVFIAASQQTSVVDEGQLVVLSDPESCDISSDLSEHSYELGNEAFEEELEERNPIRWVSSHFDTRSGHGCSDGGR